MTLLETENSFSPPQPDKLMTHFLHFHQNKHDDYARKENLCEKTALWWLSPTHTRHLFVTYSGGRHRASWCENWAYQHGRASLSSSLNIDIKGTSANEVTRLIQTTRASVLIWLLIDWVGNSSWLADWFHRDARTLCNPKIVPKVPCTNKDFGDVEFMLIWKCVFSLFATPNIVLIRCKMFIQIAPFF